MKLFYFAACLFSLVMFAGCAKDQPVISANLQPAATSATTIKAKAEKGSELVTALMQEATEYKFKLNAINDEFIGIKLEADSLKTMIPILQTQVDATARDRDEYREEARKAQVAKGAAESLNWKLGIALAASWTLMIAFFVLRAKLKSIPFIGQLLP